MKEALVLYWKSPQKTVEEPLYSFDSVRELRQSLDSYIDFYNFKRIHQALDYKILNEVYINEKGS